MIRRKMLPLCLALTMSATYIPMGTFANPDTEKINLALDKVVTTSGYEVGSEFTGDKITDGIVDRPENIDEGGVSRWASEVDAVNPWVKIDLGNVQEFDELIIDWERKNINEYTVEISEDDNTWTEIHNNTDSIELTEALTFEENKSARYVKITVDDYSSTQEGSTIDWNTASIYEVQILGEESIEPPVNPGVVIPEPGVNAALNKTATASTTETADYPASKAFDGNKDREAEKPQSRWASAVSSEDQWLKVDLGETTRFDGFVIEWERTNVVSYIIQTSNDNEEWTDVYDGSAPESVRTEIELEEAVEGQYVRLLIDEHTDGGVWNNVSVFEFEIYNGEVPETPMDATEVAEALVAPTVSAGDTTLIMPEVPEGFEIRFIGADYEEVIDRDLNIYTPLVETTVEVNFEVIGQNGDTAVSEAFEIVVPGANEVSGNAKPTVIPELREWLGGEGNFEIKDDSRIVISKSSEAELKSSMLQFAADYKDITGKEIRVIVSDEPVAGDFYFDLTTDHPELREEGHYIEIGSHVAVEANDKEGAFLATRTILQILKQNETFIPQGTVRDYPKYDVRGFMLDVGRKFHTMDFLEDVVKTMSWYKMNDFQVHINDNFIWIADHYHDNPLDAYSGFRLESDIVGENGHALTSTDGSYGKEEFKSFIEESANQGVQIVPEIDVPGHALSLIKVNPEFAYGDGLGENGAMLDVTNPVVVDFAKSVFDEYLDGGDSVFGDTTVHIGSDEFYGNAEEYRAFTDEMLTYMRDEKGRNTRVWGSLSYKSGSTPVTSEDIEMNIWNCGWANPATMYKEGYKLINTDDAYLYIVPGANYYKNYLDTSWLYHNWEANKFSNGTVVPAGCEQMIGGMFTLWNDYIDVRENGITEYDNFDRLYPAIQVLGEKMWGNAEDKTYDEFVDLAEEINYAPNTNPRSEVESKTELVLDYDFETATGDNVADNSGNDYNSKALENATFDNGLKLNGGNSFLQTGVEKLGPNYTISFTVNRETDSTEEQILFESDSAVFKAVNGKTGKVGFERQMNDYSFDYELPVGEEVELTIVGKLDKTELYVNGQIVDEISKSEDGMYGTLVFPLDKIGSETNAFEGTVKNLNVLNYAASIKDPTMIPQEGMTATATTVQQGEGANLAIDGDENTIWHSDWAGVTYPQSITIDLGGSYNIDTVKYLPRQEGDNGKITSYELQISTDGENFETVAEGEWDLSASRKSIDFDAVEATHVRLVANNAYNNFVSAAEITVHKTPEAPEVEGLGFNVSASKEEVNVNENVNITVGTENLEATDIHAMEFNVSYDTEKFDFVGATSVDDSKYIVNALDLDGTVKVLVATKGVAVENAMDLVNLEFTAKASGEAVTFNVTDGIASNGETKTEIADGEVSVNVVGEAVSDSIISLTTPTEVEVLETATYELELADDVEKVNVTYRWTENGEEVTFTDSYKVKTTGELTIERQLRFVREYEVIFTPVVDGKELEDESITRKIVVTEQEAISSVVGNGDKVTTNINAVGDVVTFTIETALDIEKLEFNFVTSNNYREIYTKANNAVVDGNKLVWTIERPIRTNVNRPHELTISAIKDGYFVGTSDFTVSIGE